MTIQTTTTHKIIIPLEFEFTEEDLTIECCGPDENEEIVEEPLEHLYGWCESDFKRFSISMGEMISEILEKEMKKREVKEITPKQLELIK